MGFIRRVFNFIIHPTHLRTIILVVFIAVVIIPATVLISQQQQHTKQRASGVDNACRPPYEGYLGCLTENSCGNIGISSHVLCSDENVQQGVYCYSSTNVGKACVTESQQVGTCDDQGSCIGVPFQTEQSTPTAGPSLTLTPTEEIILPTITTTPIQVPTISIPTGIPTSIPNISSIPTTTITPYCYLKNKGDADCDNKITNTDEKIWEREFVSELNGIPTQKQSDFNGDGVINIIDYNIWFTSSKDPSLPH